jgi:hypothetical protein
MLKWTPVKRVNPPVGAEIIIRDLGFGAANEQCYSYFCGVVKKRAENSYNRIADLMVEDQTGHYFFVYDWMDWMYLRKKQWLFRFLKKKRPETI